MTNKCIVFRSDGKYSIGIGLTLLAIQHYSPNLQFDTVIFYEEWSEMQLRTIESIQKNVHFIPINREDIQKEIVAFGKEIDDDVKRYLKRYGYFPLIWYKIYTLLDKYEKVLGLDADVLILGDISPIFSYSGFCQRTGFVSDVYNNKKIKKGNGGVVLMDRTLPYNKLAKLFIKHLFCIKYQPGTIFGRHIKDEEAFSRSIVDAGLTITDLPNDFNATPYTFKRLKYEKDLVIYHCVGSRKIWLSPYLQKIFPEYISFINTYHSIAYNIASPPSTSEKPISRVEQVESVSSCLIWKDFFDILRFDLDKFIVSFSDFDKPIIQVRLRYHLSYFKLHLINEKYIRVKFIFYKYHNHLDTTSLPPLIKHNIAKSGQHYLYQDIRVDNPIDFLKFSEICIALNTE
ncbi:MAG: hypothetical protein HDQ88_02930 [Clostridia bacterium]|nr:hypothetical protein [Clostridia bacterium]